MIAQNRDDVAIRIADRIDVDPHADA